MAKKGDKAQDRPDAAASQEAKLLWAFDGLIDVEGPVMITAWVTIIEYIDKDGDTHLAPLSSDMPPWRMTGIVDSGRESLIEDYEFFDEYDDWDE
jgi:hypothetical protein